MKFKFTTGLFYLKKRHLQLITKTFVFLCCTLTFALRANNSFSQSAKVTINKDKVLSVKQVFKLINKQTDYKFIYRHDLVKALPELPLKKGTIKVCDLLDRYLSPSGLSYSFTENSTVIVHKQKETINQKSSSQRLTIKGKVTDATGLPLPGANILEKGESNGAQTDFDGSFSLTVTDSNAILVISYLGYVTQEITVGDQTMINVQMEEDSAALDEVVVVGYGTQLKKDVTGAVSQIDTKALNVASPVNLSNALTGQLTGVLSIQTSGQPGFDSATFQIRGISTTGNNTPLVLVDGVVRPFSRINPNEIANVTVLKDAASTAIYGSRAANGVLLITTKQGKISSKPKFNFSSSYGFQTPTDRPELMDANEYVLAFRQARFNEGVAEDQLPFPDLVDDAENGRLTSYDWWNDVLTNSADQQQYNLTIDGGSEKLKYFFSYGFLDQNAFFENAGFKQNSIRSDVDAKISDNLNIRVSLAGRLENRLRSADSDGEIFSNVLRANPLNPVFVNGLPGTENLPPKSLGFDGFSGNAFGDANRNGSTRRTNDVYQSNIQLTYKIPGFEALSAKGLYAYDRTYTRNKSFFIPYTSYQLNEATGQYDIALQSDNNITLSESRSDFNRQTLQLSLNYANTFGNHDVSALLLFEQIETSFNTTSAFRDGFISSAIPEFFAGSVENDSNDGSSSETARRGYVGRVNYDYKDKYLLQANIRLDQSYIFPKEGRDGYFPAFSAGWRISEEAFMQNVGFINNLKIKGSWGITGNDRVNPFQFLSGFNFGGGYVVGGVLQQGIRPSVVANPDITWEEATSTDFGFEASLFDNLFSLEVNYYEKTTENILRPPSALVPDTFGASLPSTNIGIFDSWGWEFDISHNNSIGDFTYSIGANLTTIDNEVVFIDEAIDENPATRSTGKPFGVRFGYLSDGLYQTQEEIDNGPQQFGTIAPGDIRYKDLNGRDADGNLTGEPDGRITNDDRVVIGQSSNPDLVFGVNMNMGYKGLSLALNFQGASGFTRNIRPTGFLLGVGNNFSVLNDSWTPENPDARYPRILPDGNSNNNVASDFWLEDVHYVRLKRAELQYDFSYLISGALESVGIDHLNIVVSGTNLLTFSNISIGDPEGRDGLLFYPQAKVFSLGVNIGF
ncbi:SusC/RagA family TonB-linked outer membrane protein [Seonamhaeicola marinus]|uniref:TonB-dependent receptor n=1 Tax=Seonamhaeicola marinus TaxID=1912246 RepID=A0A5D0HTX0_9FLAO|nr:TonB-dependent receptor [Seonamhaeicola marinus]TYA74765.1 TonB-dependent receptor [Seonamhaeicola marinus]